MTQSELETAGWMAQAAADGIGQLRVGAVIIREGAVLLLRRAPHESHAGVFELPSGVVEPGEDILFALVREVAEETGLQVAAITGHVGSFDYQRANGTLGRQLNFTVEVNQGEPRLEPAEHDQMIWALFPQIADSRVAEGVRALLEQLLKNVPLPPTRGAREGPSDDEC
jgi:8-oxo-dGTP diphosphatase